MPSLYKTTAKLTYTYTDATVTQFGLTRALVGTIADCLDPDFSIVDLALTYGTHKITATFSVFGYSYCDSLKDASALMYDTIRDYLYGDMHIVDILTIPVAILGEIDNEWLDAKPWFGVHIDNDMLDLVCRDLV